MCVHSIFWFCPRSARFKDCILDNKLKPIRGSIPLNFVIVRLYSIFSFTKREQITPKCLVLSGFAVSCDYFDDKILQRGERKQLRVEFPMVTGSPSDTWQTETIYFDDKTGSYMTTINMMVIFF